ncbi:MAG: hypothetical protein EOO75_14525 [Myxococcales bacterium]|nr:MAG: hypothetical protein EOO75_14525 [Myxococcales bacterium]
MFAMQVNGKARKTYKVQLTASLVGSPDDAVVDTATSEFSSSDGTVDAAAVRKLLVQLSNSGKLTTYASDRKTRVAAAEDDLWKAANADGCKSAAKKDACEGVQAYIKKYPAGKYTADGRQALSDADASIAKKSDEDAWAAAAVDQCQKPTKSYDCKGVDAYLARFPSGTHAAQGRDALKASEKARDGLATKEKAAAKKASFADCEKACKRFYENIRPGVFEIVVGRCVETECK